MRYIYRIGPNTGLAASTTTAFWTVERVTSEPLTRRLEAAICWLHLLPISKDVEPICLNLRDAEYSCWRRSRSDEMEIRVILRALI